MQWLPLLLGLSAATAFGADVCRIEIVDKATGWPVPLVELRTTHGVAFVSDNSGLICLDAAELFDREVFFHLRGHGYGVAKDGFGYEGVRITPKAGGTERIEVDRRILARRIARLTGAGRWAESQKLGVPDLPPESGVFGCDTVQATRFHDQLFWLWGDTTLPHYPLGVFHSTAATSPLEVLADPHPPLAIDYQYFRDPEGRPRGVAKLPGDGPTWLSAMTSLVDSQGRERLVASYSKIEGHTAEHEVGLCVWDAGSSSFKVHRKLWSKGEERPPRIPRGHPVRWKDPESGKDWLLFGDPFPRLRCEPTFEAWENPAAWESLDAPRSVRSRDGGEIGVHRGSIAWSKARQRWVGIFTQSHGKPSALGEIWFTEAESPLGPWSPAIKVLSHDNYTFYNPRIDRELTPEDADFLLFEGTYTAEFADRAPPTPRYNYNQVLYRLDFADLPAR